MGNRVSFRSNLFNETERFRVIVNIRDVSRAERFLFTQGANKHKLFSPINIRSNNFNGILFQIFYCSSDYRRISYKTISAVFSWIAIIIQWVHLIYCSSQACWSYYRFDGFLIWPCAIIFIEKFLINKWEW